MAFKDYLNEGKEEAMTAILDFFTDNPSPPDEDIHALSDKLKINTHEFEAMIYSILGSFLGAGRSKEKGITEKDVDTKELTMGMKLEMEHTTSKYIAKRIALDHLSEHNNSDYYTRLAKMEDMMNKELGGS